MYRDLPELWKVESDEYKKQKEGYSLREAGGKNESLKKEPLFVQSNGRSLHDTKQIDQISYRRQRKKVKCTMTSGKAT